MKKANGAIRGIVVTAVVLTMITVVLSTATYAWYRVVNRAVGNSVTFHADSNNSGGGELTLTWDLDVLNNFSIDFNNPSNDLYPMIPIKHAVVGETTYQEFVTNNFNTTTQTVNSLGEYVAKLTGMQIDPFLVNGNAKGGTQNYFYLVNTNDDLAMEVEVMYIYSGILSDKLRIAMFEGEDPDNLVLLGVMSISEEIAFGAIEKNTPLNSIQTMPEVQRQTKEMKITIPAGGHRALALVAWLDGNKMHDDNARQTTSFIVKFDGYIKS